MPKSSNDRRGTRSSARQAGQQEVEQELQSTWYAVVVELKDVTYHLSCGFRHEIFGTNETTGALLKVDIEQGDRYFSVVLKAGSALKQMAGEKAIEHGGKLIEVVSDYMFNVSDIDVEKLIEDAE